MSRSNTRPPAVVPDTHIPWSHPMNRVVVLLVAASVFPLAVQVFRRLGDMMLAATMSEPGSSPPA